MKTLRIAVFLFMVCFAAVGVYAEPVDWHTAPPTSDMHRPILILFYTPETLGGLERDIFGNDLFVKLSKIYYCRKVDVKDHPFHPLASKYKINRAPSVVLVKPDGTVQNIFREYVSYAALVTEMGQYYEESGGSASKSSAAPAAVNEIYVELCNDKLDVQSGARDFVNASCAISDENLKIKVEFVKAAEVSGFHFCVDADGDPKTGFNFTNIAGAEFMIEGATLFVYDGKDQSEWVWRNIKTLPMKTRENILEIDLPYSEFGLTRESKFNGAFYTSGDDWNPLDYMPDASPVKFPLEIEAMDFKVALENGGVKDFTLMCEDKADIEENKRDFRNAFMNFENDQLTLLVEFYEKAEIDGFHFCVDTDNDRQTGYSTANISGCDYMIEGASMYMHQGASATDWSWAPLKGVDYKLLGNVIKITVPLADLKLKEGGTYNCSFFTTGSDWLSADFMPDNTPVRMTLK